MLKAASRRDDAAFAVLFGDETKERTIGEVAQKARDLKSRLKSFKGASPLPAFAGSAVHINIQRTWIENRELWRKGLLWTRSALALKDLLPLSLEPGHRGAKRLQAHFEEVCGKRTRCE